MQIAMASIKLRIAAQRQAKWPKNRAAILRSKPAKQANLSAVLALTADLNMMAKLLPAAGDNKPFTSQNVMCHDIFLNHETNGGPRHGTLM